MCCSLVWNGVANPETSSAWAAGQASAVCRGRRLSEIWSLPDSAARLGSLSAERGVPVVQCGLPGEARHSEDVLRDRDARAPASLSHTVTCRGWPRHWWRSRPAWRRALRTRGTTAAGRLWPRTAARPQRRGRRRWPQPTRPQGTRSPRTCLAAPPQPLWLLSAPQRCPCWGARGRRSAAHKPSPPFPRFAECALPLRAPPACFKCGVHKRCKENQAMPGLAAWTGAPDLDQLNADLKSVSSTSMCWNVVCTVYIENCSYGGSQSRTVVAIGKVSGVKGQHTALATSHAPTLDCLMAWEGNLMFAARWMSSCKQRRQRFPTRHTRC